VKIERQGLTLAYRRGYYADDPDARLKDGREKAAAAQDRFGRTEQPGSPSDDAGRSDSSQIVLKIRVLL